MGDVGPRLVAYILTRDEEAHVAEVVQSVSQVTDHVVVVDSGSTDATRELAREAGAAVWQRTFDNFSSQRNWAIDRIESMYHPAWVLSLDADERLSALLAEEVRQVTTPGSSAHDVYLVRRRVHFAGRALRFGGFARTRLPRLYRPNAGRYEQRLVNEHLLPSPGARVGKLRGWLVHEDVVSWERHIAKHNLYSTLEAHVRYERDKHHTGVSISEVIRRPYLRRRFLRERLWNPLPAKPLLRFFQTYVISGGFLDGSAGYKAALFQAWQEMCTELKYRQLVEHQS